MIMENIFDDKFENEVRETMGGLFDLLTLDEIGRLKAIGFREYEHSYVKGRSVTFTDSKDDRLMPDDNAVTVYKKNGLFYLELCTIMHVAIDTTEILVEGAHSFEELKEAAVTALQNYLFAKAPFDENMMRQAVNRNPLEHEEIMAIGIDNAVNKTYAFLERLRISLLSL